MVAGIASIVGSLKYWPSGSTRRAEFPTIAALALASVLAACAAARATDETIPAGPDSFKHVPDGVPVDYGTLFPTSGMHSEVGAHPGFYTEPQLLPRLVHALEHGHIVVYYDQPSEDVIEQLKAWTEEFTRESGGVIAAPDPTLGRGIVLTAWEKRLILDRFDQGAALRFIHAYLGQGPD